MIAVPFPIIQLLFYRDSHVLNISFFQPKHSLPLLQACPAPEKYALISSHLLRLVPHSIQVLNNREIRIQKPIDTVLRAALLVLLQLAASDRTGYAFAPADIGKVVYRCLVLALVRSSLAAAVDAGRTASLALCSG